jgi:hypothetical protein
MVCGDINYTIDSNGVNCVTVELSDGQIATIGSYVRESRAPDIPENSWKVHGIMQFKDSLSATGKSVAVIGDCNRKNVNACALSLVLS